MNFYYSIRTSIVHNEYLYIYIYIIIKYSINRIIVEAQYIEIPDLEWDK